MQHAELPPKELPLERSARQRIVAGARRHFFVHGLRGVTMDDLAEELGMSKKTLYAHFPSKTALVEAALLAKFQDVEAELERITSACSSDFPGALHKLLACIQRHTGEIQPPFLRDIRREAPELFKIVESRRRDVIQRHFGKLLRAGRKAGIIRKDIPATIVTEILLGAVQAIMNPTKMAELALTPKSGFSAILTVILEGVVTEKGRSNL
jgi:AcrR family transcriptional regulator